MQPGHGGGGGGRSGGGALQQVPSLDDPPAQALSLQAPPCPDMRLAAARLQAVLSLRGARREGRRRATPLLHAVRAA